MNTRRYPRTLQEAFGPYTAASIEAADSPRLHWTTWAAYAVCVVGALVLAWYLP